jgi:hypothetical protein
VTSQGCSASGRFPGLATHTPPPGGPGEAPDGRLPRDMQGFGRESARPRGDRRLYQSGGGGAIKRLRVICEINKKHSHPDPKHHRKGCGSTPPPLPVVCWAGEGPLGYPKPKNSGSGFLTLEIYFPDHLKALDSTLRYPAQSPGPRRGPAPSPGPQDRAPWGAG